MAAQLVEQRVTCPWCGEPLHLLLDLSAGDQAYTEDCQVCCRPMRVAFTTAAGELESLQVDCES
ncbi:MAG: CPXCG motif-containing cysteine-rich protein [Woeseiaceae bacterium]|nr:CPXCG motif-containing cysteine-rich protein [Woeseiaceae bacterium]